MKKFLLTCAAAISMAASANAQLAEATLFPYPGGASGGLTAVNAPFTGQRYNLDSISNAGYTIFIDISATWCPPCWAYHNSKQLDSLWYFHGPTGMSGVSSSTTNDVFVFFFQGEPTSNLAELNGNTAGGAIVTTAETDLAHDTQGDWVAGTPFPMIDDTTSTDANYGTNNVDAAWHIAFFPTVYMICRDHLVHNLTQPTYPAAYAAAQADCPTYPPASGSSIDAKATTYAGTASYFCSANPTVTFQNYSSTTAITSATVTVTDASGTTLATVPWSGSLAPFALANVAIPSFAGTSLGGYKYNVSVTGDINLVNNVSVDSVFKVYATSNADVLPWGDSLMSTPEPYKYTFCSDYSIGLPNPLWSGCPNPHGVTTNKYLLFDFYDFQTGTGIFNLPVDNFNTSGLGSVTLEFDQAYQEYTGYPSDQMDVKVSNDCGATWQTIWSATGAALGTVPAVAPGSGWNPAAASDWTHRTVSIPTTDFGNNMMLNFTGVSGYGNFAWVTDIRLTGGTLSVAQVNPIADFITVTPNPAKDLAYVNVTVNETTNVMVQVYDAVGRIVNTVSQELSTGDQKIAIPTTDLAAGLYIVKITAGTTVTSKQLSVVK